MVPNGVAEIVELIWHFSGYMRLDPDGVARVSIDYNGGLRPTDPYEAPVDATTTSPRLSQDDFDSEPGPPITLMEPEDYRWVITIRSHPSEAPQHPHEPKESHLPLKPFPLPPAGGGGGSSSGGFEFTSIKPSINQEIVDIRQFNIMENNDYASIGLTALPLEPFDTGPMLVTMMGDARGAVPADLLPAEGNSSSTLEFVNFRDAHPAETHAEVAPYIVEPGKYVNGELQDPDTDVHQVTNDTIDVAATALDTGMIQPIPHGNYSDSAIQNVVLGNNISVNDTTLISGSGLCGSMLILGDSHQTAAIFQTNVLVQSDHFEVAPGGDAGVNFIPNLVQNIADFSTEGAVDGPWLASGPVSWSVSVLHGSLFDVKCMTQVNYISDNDVVSQTQSAGYSLVLAGSNEQVNAIDFQSPLGQWDLIVVEGSYHQLSLINQTNVVLDMNHASQDWVGYGGDASGTQGIDAGNNMLLNDASIIYVGAKGSLATNDSMIELAKVLADNHTPDSSLIASAFPNLSGTINVLYVQGDYYDINYLSQTNIISDADVAAQLLTTDGKGGQSLSTGGNTAVNSATIVDAGSLTTPYVHGDAYSDTILIQTNIIATDSKVVTNDPAALVPEIVAFTGTDAPDHHQDAPQLFAPPDPQQHDILAGTLH